MTKNEFIEYAGYLGKLFGFDAPTDKDVLGAWYKPFEKVHIDIAREMAQLYLKQETGRFKLAKLLEYKEQAMRGKTYSEKIEGYCKICRNVGYVMLEKRDNGKIYVMANRCICKLGQDLNKSIKTVEEKELMERYKDYNDIYRLEKPSLKAVDVQEFKQEKLGGFI